MAYSALPASEQAQAQGHAQSQVMPADGEIVADGGSSGSDAGSGCDDTTMAKGSSEQGQSDSLGEANKPQVCHPVPRSTSSYLWLVLIVFAGRMGSLVPRSSSLWTQKPRSALPLTSVAELNFAPVRRLVA